MKTKNHILRSVTAAALLLAFTAIPSAYAQDTAIEQAADNVQHVKQTFSREGRRSWYPEVSVDGHAMIWMASADLAIGARTDNDRVFGLGGGLGEHCYDALPGRAYYASAYLWHRHYAHFGKKERFALYSDFRLGAGCIYKTTDHCKDDMPAEDSILPVLRWEPGLSLRIARQFRFNLGPVIGTDIIGLHAGFSI